MQAVQATSVSNQSLLAAAALLLALVAVLSAATPAMGRPMQQQQGEGELDDLGDDGVDSPQIGAPRSRSASSLDGDNDDFPPQGAAAAAAAGSGSNFNNDMGQQQYANFRPQARAGAQDQYQREPQQPMNYNNALQQQASENSENNASDGDNETDADDDSDFGPMGLTAANAGAASNNGYRPASYNLGGDSNAGAQGLQGASAGASGNLNFAGEADVESGLDGSGEPDGLDSNIANAKIEMSPQDMATAAGHHHHHGHYVHGWLKMGAETGKKGAFKWHDKHPVGGKGRR